MKTRLLIIFGISIIGLLSLYGEKNDAFGFCKPGTDWSDKPCYACPGCYPGLEEEKIAWEPYYDYKGSEWMELKKQEMNLAIQNDTLSEWIHLTSKTQAHHNVHKYYFLQGEVLRHGMTFSESIEYNKVWNAKRDIRTGHAIVINVTTEELQGFEDIWEIMPDEKPNCLEGTTLIEGACLVDEPNICDSDNPYDYYCGVSDPSTVGYDYGVELGYALLIVPPSILGILLVFIILRNRK